MDQMARERAPDEAGTSASSFRILLVEENSSDARRILDALDAARGAAFTVVQAASLQEAHRRCAAEPFELALVGSALTEPRSLEPLRALSAARPGMPIVLLTGLEGESLAHLAVYKGTAQDYLVKGHLTPELVEQSILYALSRARMMTGLKDLRRQGSSATAMDRQTQLPGRSVFYDRLGDALDQARRSSRMASVLLVHLEGFKMVQSTLGPGVGDPLVREIAGRLVGSLEGRLSPADIVARLSGEEFGVVLGDIPQMKNVSDAAESIIESFAQPFVQQGLEFFIGATIGISLFPFDGSDPESMLHDADIALRRAKEQGSGSFQFFLPAVNDQFLTRLELQNSLRLALARDEFVVHYMPQVDVLSGRIVSMEALVRWKHPTLGLVPPTDFIPLAEETGLILPIGERVLRAACGQVRTWQKAGLPPIRVSVNFSARQFQHQNPVALVKKVLGDTGLPPAHLELEITESAVMKDAGAALATLRLLKETGIHLAIDDFGTGYSSLSYLRSFPIDALKVDRSFVRDVTTRPEDEAIVTAVIAMAHSLKLKVIAEGVETEQHLTWLHTKNCDEAQGYYFSRPVPAEAAAALLSKMSGFRY